MTLIFPLDIPIKCMEMQSHQHSHHNNILNNTNNNNNNNNLITFQNNNNNILDGEVLDRLEKEYQTKIYNIKIALDTPPDLLANIKFLQHQQQQQQNHFVNNNNTTINGNFQQDSEDDVMLEDQDDDDDDEYDSSSDDDFINQFNPIHYHDMNTSIYIPNHNNNNSSNNNGSNNNSNNGNMSNLLNQGLLSSPNTQYIIQYIDEEELEDTSILNISRISPPQSPPHL
ncbi:hypothetical protein NAEGRDRAFT_75078 [Naegleria gruberi]|uniref:Uncharacterized protein n=1 Tax=Naegleria gruberi TaxID=5762 RepID=D2W139_NAEGR|nr:uncharacterized protein NAEGRDRAFT_75078 [Naegleria gruberi]EFC37295.1 hypothetical protein NAEGRDRAFT_75078 [Naegleria gruberi]|eukprot:XP_002670039.1 hypothetical protein NAEGRDRAFT_75078 [Naegleria gruberi strain NEG-M]